MRLKQTALVFTMASAFMSFTACEEDEITREKIEPVTVNHALTQMDSCDAYLDFAKETARQRMRAMVERDCQDMLRYVSSRDDKGIDVPVNASDADIGSDESAGGDFSQTNTQEIGVDEADLVKTDGNYIYTISGHDLVVISINEIGVLTETGRISLTGRPTELFLYGDIAVVFATLVEEDVPESLILPTAPVSSGASGMEPDVDYMYYLGAYTGIDVIDLSEKSAPTLLRSAQYAGRYVSSRRVDGAVRAVLSSPLSALDMPTWVNVDYWDMDEMKAKRAVNRACDALLAENEKAIDALTIDDILPKKYDTADETAEPIAQCTDIYGPKTPAGTGLLTVVSLDLSKPTEKQQDVAVLGEEGQVYASPSALYLTTSGGYVLTAWESGLWEDETSGIYKFDIASDPSKAVYLASGTVEGRMLNQFSLGEYDDRLRVATTTGSAWWGEEITLDNHVTIFKAQDDNLTVEGKLSGIGTGEEIYAARFMGNRGFVVTFLQTDPLFTLDLSDPADPKMVGEWVGPGYSTYLHPFGENHLIAMGRDENWRTGVTLYDLSDYANPTLVERQPLVGVNYETAALYEHKAFTFNAETGDLLLPFYDWDNSTGVLVYNVTDTGIALTGTLSMDGSVSVEGPSRRAMYNRNAVIGVGACRITSAAMADPTQIISSIPIYDDACEFPSWYY